MITAVPTQEEVDRVAHQLAPDVVRIRVRDMPDWSDHAAIYFRVILSDEASRRDRLEDVAKKVRKTLTDELGLANLEHIPYFKFRSQSEQAELREAAWE